MARKMKTMGNNTVAHVSYHLPVAAIYPITPSSIWPKQFDEWSATE